MAREDRTSSESEESEALEGSSSGGEGENGGGNEQKGVSEYEKQRLSRIAENKARMEALGLSKMASSLIGSSRDSSKRKGKQKAVKEDDDYRPNEDDELAEDDESDDEDDDDEDFEGKSSSRSGKRKVKNKSSKSRKKPVKKDFSSSDYVIDDEDLMKAIALSLQDPAGTPTTLNCKKKGIAEDRGKGKGKRPFTSRVQMTEDELIIHFFQFDEAGKGSISLRDLERMAFAHDFTWTDEELADMIRCFDSDRDGKLSLDDFRKIVERCRMLRGPDGS